MKARSISNAVAACSFAMLCGCVSVGQTHMLVTPVGAAGIHSFAPPPSPDNLKQLDSTAQRLAAMQKQSETSAN